MRRIIASAVDSRCVKLYKIIEGNSGISLGDLKKESKMLFELNVWAFTDVLVKMKIMDRYKKEGEICYKIKPNIVREDSNFYEETNN